jgi:hypothetical protein
VAVAAALTGAAGAEIAHADGIFPDIGGSTAGAASDLATNTVPAIVTADPLELLKDASANLTEANHVLSTGTSDIPGVMQQPDAQNIALSELASLYTAESSLSSYDNGAFADSLNPWFNLVDQGWNQGTEALFNADQAVETAVTAGSGVDAAVLGVFAADFQLAADMFNSLPIEFAAGFTDPSIFTDLVTGVGF